MSVAETLTRHSPPWFVTDNDLLAFICTHPADIRLDKADSPWFLDFILGTDLQAQTLLS